MMRVFVSRDFQSRCVGFWEDVVISFGIYLHLRVGIWKCVVRVTFFFSKIIMTGFLASRGCTIHRSWLRLRSVVVSSLLLSVGDCVWRVFLWLVRVLLCVAVMGLLRSVTPLLCIRGDTIQRVAVGGSRNGSRYASIRGSVGD